MSDEPPPRRLALSPRLRAQAHAGRPHRQHRRV